MCCFSLPLTRRGVDQVFLGVLLEEMDLEWRRGIRFLWDEKVDYFRFGGLFGMNFFKIWRKMRKNFWKDGWDFKSI